MSTLTDPRDGQTYKTIRCLDGNDWLAEGLRYRHGETLFERDILAGYYTGYSLPEIAIPGWRVPTFYDWKQLTACYTSPGEELKSNGFNLDGTGRMETQRHYKDGVVVLNDCPLFWTSTPYFLRKGLFSRKKSPTNCFYLASFFGADFGGGAEPMHWRFQVRLVRNK